MKVKKLKHTMIRAKAKHAFAEKNQLLDAALRYAAAGYRVFPVKAGCNKPPLIKKWQFRATTDERKIRAWWGPSRWSNANIAITTGAADNLFVLDFDCHKGARGLETKRALEEQHGDWPKTLVQRSPSGGLHYFFASTDQLRCTQSKVGAGVDTLGEVGYIVVEPSIVGGKQYAWQN